MNYRIDTGIRPVPNTAGRGGQIIYPLDKLEVGQSFFVPLPDDKLPPSDDVEGFRKAMNCHRSNLVAACGRYRHNEPTTKFSCLLRGGSYYLDDEIEGAIPGVRVFRVM